MGSYASTFREEDGNAVAKVSQPSSADWITAHATVTNLAIVEVERLWLRFQQLGCNEAGTVTIEVLQKSGMVDDAFMRNILNAMLSDGGLINFQTFLNVMKWAETTTTESKIRALFHLVNGGEPIKRDILARVLGKLYPDDTEAAIQKITDVFMQEMDKKKQGYITEEQFVSHLETMPHKTIETMLEFHIIPPDINEDAHRTFTALTKQSWNTRTGSPAFGRQIPSDPTIKMVADKVHKRDWHVLANKLGFTARDISELENKTFGDTTLQVDRLLKHWRSREGESAYVETLEKALRDSNMTDVALLLHP